MLWVYHIWLLLGQGMFILCLLFGEVVFFFMQQILFSIVSPNIQHKKSLQRIQSALIKASLYQKKIENILLTQNILHLNDKLQKPILGIYLYKRKEEKKRIL